MTELAAKDEAKRPIAYEKLGQAQSQLGQHQEAIASHEQALAGDARAGRLTHS